MTLPKAVIFDMDGVIFDTERLVLDCWQEVADRYHIPDVKQVCMECLGVNQQTAERIFKKHYGADFPYAERKAEMRALFFGDRYGEHLPLKPGICKLFLALREDHIPTALASSTRSAVVLKELADAGLTGYLDQIICGDMVSHSKPDPEIFLTAAKKLGMNPAECWVIEDSYNGIRAAYAGGFVPVMVPDLMAPDEEMRSKAAYIAEDLTEVERMLVSFKR